VPGATPRTDEQLLHAFSRGHESAFEELVARHGAPVKAYALRLLHSREQAEEVFEETFLRVIRAKGRWEARGTVRGYLFTIAHRLCLDILRKRRLEREAVPTLVQMSQSRTVTPSPEAAALLGERATQLETAIGQLAEEHRDVLLLRAIHGLSVAETAAVLGITPTQVYDRMSYARKRLATLLQRNPPVAKTRELP